MEPVHILLVEDNEGDILLIEEAFEEARLINTISVLRNGEAAIRFLDQEGEYENAKSPDLIILDVNLPRKNGHEVLKYVKTNNDFKQIPVIMLTTSSANKDIERSYENHANCYITKPVDVDDFMQAVMSIESFWISLVQLPPKH